MCNPVHIRLTPKAKNNNSKMRKRGTHKSSKTPNPNTRITTHKKTLGQPDTRNTRLID